MRSASQSRRSVPGPSAVSESSTVCAAPGAVRRRGPAGAAAVPDGAASGAFRCGGGFTTMPSGFASSRSCVTTSCHSRMRR